MRALLRNLGLVAGLVLITLLLIACGGPVLEGNVYRSDDIAFRLGPRPSEWRAIDVDGALLSFRDDPASATIAVNGRCGVDGDDVPLKALTHHLFLNFTAREVVAQEELELDGRAALRTEMNAELDGVPRKFVVFVLKKDGCVYDFMWIGPSENSSAAVGVFERFVRGFSTEV
jgi:hypothetical protein